MREQIFSFLLLWLLSNQRWKSLNLPTYLIIIISILFEHLVYPFSVDVQSPDLSVSALSIHLGCSKPFRMIIDKTTMPEKALMSPFRPQLLTNRPGITEKQNSTTKCRCKRQVLPMRPVKSYHTIQAVLSLIE